MTIKSYGPGSNLAGAALAALRIMSALLFMAHGIQKFFGFPSIRYGLASPMSLMGVAGILELVGGLLLLLGLLTRPVAFLLAGEMAVAYFMAHASKGMFPIDNGGESAILFCFVFLLLAAAGPGALSVDGIIRRGRNDPAAL